MKSQALLHLMHLVSPALPVGAYAYSQGLEYAIDSGWLDEKGALGDWIGEVLHMGPGHLDLPVLRRSYQALESGDWEAFNDWNDFIRAARETRELLLEDEQLGQALSRLLVSLEVQGAAREHYRNPPGFVCQFALAGYAWQVPLDDLARGFAWSWLENQIAAATKIVPLGQTQAQQLLLALMPEVERVCEQAKTVPTDELGLSLPGLVMSSGLHERQYSRLFRS